jgi:hypothetical protein
VLMVAGEWKMEEEEGTRAEKGGGIQYNIY